MALRNEIVTLLQSVPNGKIHLFKFRELFEKRYVGQFLVIKGCYSL